MKDLDEYANLSRDERRLLWDRANAEEAIAEALAAERARIAALLEQHASSDGLEDGRTCLPTAVWREIVGGGG